jgi:hypothetical protein
MLLHELHDSSNEFVMNLLEVSLSKITDNDIIKNYHPDYKNDPANIFYILNDVHGRYNRGCYYVLEDDGEYVCSAGWNQYDLDSTIALALTRAYVEPKYRTKYYMGEFILPKIIESARDYEHLYITADSYNSAIYQWFVRAEAGKSPGMFSDWPDIYKNFKPIGQKTIYYTEQYVVEYKNEYSKLGQIN